MVRTAYYTTETASGATVQTFLDSAQGAGYLKVSKPISVSELIQACPQSELKVYSPSHNIEIDPSEFKRIAGKTFVPGNGAWAVGGQSLKGSKNGGNHVECHFEVQEAADGGFYVIAYAEVHALNAPMRRVQLNVEFD